MRSPILMLLSSVLLLGGVAETAQQVLVMPRELVEYAEANDCHQVDDFFFAHRNMVDPPYAYGYYAGKKQDSAILWCQTGEGEQRKFWLLIMQKNDEKRSDTCPQKFEVKGGYPGGLTSSTAGRNRDGLVIKTLDDFHYLAEPRRRKPPKGVKITGTVIVSTYGPKELFYCYRGSWVFLAID